VSSNTISRMISGDELKCLKGVGGLDRDMRGIARR
jgi:hypothetical protein